MGRPFVIHRPDPPEAEPKPPSWWRTFWLPPGTVVEHEGELWLKRKDGDEDGTWSWWEIITEDEL